VEYETKVEIAAPKQRVWDLLADVEHWADLTASITSIELINKPLAPDPPPRSCSQIIEGSADGPVTMTLGIKQSGWPSHVVSFLNGRLTREYVDMEAAGLRRAAEGI
jgi:hypothetical protein